MFSDLDNYVEIEGKDIVIPWDNPWLQHFATASAFRRRFISALADLLPGSRPDDVMDSKYAKFVHEERDPDLPVDRLSMVCEKAVKLIDSIYEHGFVKGEEWTEPQEHVPWHVGPPTWYGPVTFGIDSNGQLVHHDGMHRTSIAWLTGQPLPVRIVAHHKEWALIHARIKEVGLYDHWPHPEFLDGRTIRQNSSVRFAKVLDEVRYGPPTTGRVVDLGSCSGHWPAMVLPYKQTVVVELSALYRQMAQSWLTTISNNYAIRHDWREVDIRDSDIVTAFSVVHHIGTTKEILDELLHKIMAAKTLILEVPLNHDQLWHADVVNNVERPWDYVDQKIRSSGYNSTVLFVDTVHSNRQTICYRR